MKLERLLQLFEPQLAAYKKANPNSTRHYSQCLYLCDLVNPETGKSSCIIYRVGDIKLLANHAEISPASINGYVFPFSILPRLTCPRLY